jgi:hypothetical protein
MHQKQPPANIAISVFSKILESFFLLADCFEALLIFFGIKVERIKKLKNIKNA